jgi:hypothetical protein
MNSHDVLVTGPNPLPSRVREARLLKSSPEDVFRDLQDEATSTTPWTDLDRDLERSLFARTDPLINLALAQFGTTRDLVSEIYEAATLPETDLIDGRYKLGVRVACLSNRRITAYAITWEFPLALVGPKEFARLVSSGTYDEYCALLQNPGIHAGFLEGLYKRSGVFSQLDDRRWCHLVTASAENIRLTTYIDYPEDPDLGYYNIHQGLADLLENAPTTPEWVMTIYRLVLRLRRRHVHGAPACNSIVKRWWDADATGHDGKLLEGWFTKLPLNQELACYLAALYGLIKPDTNYSQSDDIAMRCIYYGASSKLNAADFKRFYDRDQAVFTMAASLNEELLYKRSGKLPRKLTTSDAPDTNLSIYMEEMKRHFLAESEFGEPPGDTGKKPDLAKELHAEVTTRPMAQKNRFQG